MSDQLPERITDDPRIGQNARCIDTGFTGVIECIFRFADGSEYFSVQQGSFARGSVEANNIVIGEEVGDAHYTL